LRCAALRFQLADDISVGPPILLPKGTKIHVSARYDNSPNDASNPDPKADVYWGEQTWGEMLAGFVDFAIPVHLNPARIAREPKGAEVAQVH
jgi:hypothetical protein